MTDLSHVSVSKPTTVAREAEYTVCLTPSHMSILGLGDGMRSVSSESHASRRGVPHQREMEVYYHKQWEEWILSKEKLEMDI